MDGFFDVVASFAIVALDAAISSAPLCLIVGAITFAGRRWFSARTRFALWTLVLVRMVMPFSMETSFGLGMLTNRLPDNSAPPASIVNDLSMAMPLPSAGARFSSQPATTASTGPGGYRWVYLIGIAIMFGMICPSVLLAVWFLVTSIRTSRRIRRGIDPENSVWKDLLHQGRCQFGIRVPVRLRTVQNWRTPATMGFFRPIIILPDDSESLTDTELQHVLWHELAHIKRGDAAWSYLWIAARCLQWWNPCFWWTQRCWLAERELACDALVMQHLGSSAASEYGRTLIHFLERLSELATSPHRIPLPGLVMLLGDKATMRRRLAALAHPLALETIWGRCCSLALLVLLAAMGLTDAAVPQTETPRLNSVTVPAGTVWQFGENEGDAADPSPLPTITRDYDVSGALAGIQRQEPGATADFAVRDAIQTDHSIFPWIQGKPQKEQCQIRGNQLIVTATEAQHRTIQNQLNHWQEFGRRQICLEVRFWSTPKELSDFLPVTGGKIVSPSPSRETDLLRPANSPHDVHNSLSGPSFVRVLTPAEHTNATNRLQGDLQTSSLFAPKVAIFSGSSAVVQDMIQRPFVTGLRTTESGGREPQISNVKEGLQVGVGSTLLDAAENIRLSIHVRLSEIAGVETLTAKLADRTEETTIQIPHLRESNLKTSMTIANGHTVLVSPLRRDKHGKLQLFLITPRLIAEY